MQTLHLRFRDLRAILLGQRPGRWPSPSLRSASTWKGAPPLPNLPRPTLAVGSHPATSHQRPDRCPTVGAGLPLASSFREAWIVGPSGADPCRVCPRQTASELTPDPAPHEAGDQGSAHWQARASEVARSRARPSPGRSPGSSLTPSFGLSFPLRPQPSGGRACGKKTADRTAHVGALAGVSIGARRRRSSSAGG